MEQPPFSPERYKEALTVAASAHARQETPTGLPYLAHVAAVAMEVTGSLGPDRWAREAADLGVQCALLHDVIEDTDWSAADLIDAGLSEAVCGGVQALTKDASIRDKADRMADSLGRLQRQPAAVQAVKLADRITNLDPPPPQWDAPKIRAYADEAEQIRSALGSSSPWLRERLRRKIADYRRLYVSA